ncbi:MAG: GNAT family N-acetyltransferase [Bdellovibrionaceae bacterium]|jgi:[ribosomal protein S5]-alanine N-acetyltransferase|nr:GNAT family N-acetyltransferase [Pseudobdellovibrionaceae bacterium]
MTDIETNNLIVRPFIMSDLTKVFQLSQELSLAKWMPDQVYKDEEETAGVLDFLITQYQGSLKPDEKPLVLAIVLKNTNELIGHVGLSPYKNNIEVGYAISDEYCGKGYATEAVTSLVNWALSNLETHKILGVVASENIGSRRVLEKSGFLFNNESKQIYHGQMRLCRKYSLSK